MGSSADLTLGCKDRPFPFSKESREFVVMEEHVKYRQQLEDYTKALEEERRKIDAFKRELPLCMQLLNDAIQGSRDQLAEFQTSATNIPINLVCEYGKVDLHHGSDNPMLEEFMPLNCQKEKARKEEAEEQQTKKLGSGCDQSRPSWIVEAQLWREHPEWADMNQQEKNGTTYSQNQREESGLDTKQRCSSSSSKFILSSAHGSGGAFSPFVRGKQWEGIVSPSEDTFSGAKLTLSSGLNHLRESPLRIVDEVGESSVRGLAETQATEVFPRHITTTMEKQGSRGGSLNSGHEISEQAQRKARRCWSPELHRRFLSALEQLGGSQVATPKQIRELMKVDGLTNDEVKSHLQKYRLHTRRSSPVPLSSASTSAQVVVLGGIWMPPDYAAVSATAQTNLSVYDSVPNQHQPSYLSNFGNESLSHLKSSPQEEIHHPVYFEQQPASHSKTSSQGHNESPCQLSLCPEGSSEGCGDASFGNVAKSDSTSRKGDNRPCRISIQGIITREPLEEDDDGDVTEAEDSRGSESIEDNKNEGHEN